MKGQLGFAPAHTLIKGGGRMGKKKSYSLHFICVDNRTSDIVRALAKREIERVLAKHGAVSYNLDEVLSKYISGEMRNDQK